MRLPVLLTVVGVAVGVVVGAVVVILDDEGPAPGDEVSLAPSPVTLDPSGTGPNDLDVARDLLDGWWRSRMGTYVAEGSFTRTLPDESQLQLRRTLVQRPPDVVLVQSGEVRASLDGAIVRCAVDPQGEQRCTTGGTAAEHRAAVLAELERFATLLQGSDPVYRLSPDAGCFVLELAAPIDPAPYGERARICFDRGTGAVSSFRLERDGIVDEVVVTAVRPTVTDDDLRVALAG